MNRHHSKSENFPYGLRGYIDVILEKGVSEIVQNCIDNKIFYGIFRISGDSMTCEDARSIPDGSGVMVYDLEIDFNRPLIDNIAEIPLRTPLALVMRDKNGQIKCLVKTITFVDAVYNRFLLTSYNPAPEYNGWVPVRYVEKVYKVLQVIKKEALRPYSSFEE